MMTEKKRRNIYWLLKFGGVLVSCLFPVVAVCEKFPVWKAQHTAERSLGAGAIIILIVVAIVFRKSVFEFFKERLKLQHAPPLAIWIVLLIISYVLIYIRDFMNDLTKVLWMGLIGCSVGTLLTFIGENFFGEKKEE